jgi:hypothetical protein
MDWNLEYFKSRFRAWHKVLTDPRLILQGMTSQSNIADSVGGTTVGNPARNRSARWSRTGSAMWE